MDGWREKRTARQEPAELHHVLLGFRCNSLSSCCKPQMISGEISLHHAESSPMSHLILCLQHSTKPRRRQSLVPSTCFKRFVCAAGQHRTAWMAPPFRIFSMRSVAACQCSEPKKLACDNIWPYIYIHIYCFYLFLPMQHCSNVTLPCPTRMHPWNPWHSMAAGDALESSPSALALPFTAAAASSKAFLAASAALFASRACGVAEEVTWRFILDPGKTVVD